MERISSGVADVIADKMVETFQNGSLAVYTGNQPASANDAETGTLLCVITRDGGAMTPGQPANGLNFVKDASTGSVKKDPDETWSGEVIADGTPGWFRFYDNSRIQGASTTAKRFDGSIGAGALDEIQLSKFTLYREDTVDILTFKLNVTMENNA